MKVINSDGEIKVTVGTGGGGHTIQEDGSDLPAEDNLNFADGLLATDDAGNSATKVDIDYATTEIADVAAAEGAGASTKVPRADHVHAHGTGYLPNAHHNQSHSQSDHAGTGSPAELSDSAAAAGTGTLPANVDHTHKKAVNVRKNSTGLVSTRPRLNLIEGSNIGLTVTDDGVDDEVDITITATAGGVIGSPITVAEEDSSPSVNPVTTIKVSNGTLVDNTGGSVSIDTRGMVAAFFYGASL